MHTEPRDLACYQAVQTSASVATEARLRLSLLVLDFRRRHIPVQLQSSKKRDAFLPTSHLPARPAEIVDYTCRHPRRRARLRNPRKASASLRPTRKHTCSRKTVASNSNPLVPTLQAAAGRRPHTASRRSQAAAHRMAEKRGGRGAAPRTAAPVGSGGGRLRAGAL